MNEDATKMYVLLCMIVQKSKSEEDLDEIITQLDTLKLMAETRITELKRKKELCPNLEYRLAIACCKLNRLSCCHYGDFHSCV